MRKNIEIVSASAGSGKTHRLTKVLSEKVTRGVARPEAVIAVTFTKKAAGELQERVGARLPEVARVSRIGTIHSICGALLSDFAFELGLSPDLEVLSEERAIQEVKKAIAEIVSPDELEALTRLTDRMVEFDWQESVKKIIDEARSNGISAEDLDASRAKSVERIEALFPETAGAGAIEDGLSKALESFIAEVGRGSDRTSTTKGALEDARRALDDLGANRMAWKTWASLAHSFKTAVPSRGPAEVVKEAAAAYAQHPALAADMIEATELVYGVARRAMTAYQQRKREWGAVDFVDQEALMLRLLREPSARERLEGEIDLILVDEFQDTNPMQLAIFLELAGLAKESVWVGDQKQSIFGFRGADPSLMDAAIAAILAGGEPETLPFSHRSRPALVHATSDLFAKAFAVHGFPESRVRLAPKEETEPENMGPIVESWTLLAKGKASERGALAAGVKSLLGDPATLVRDGDGVRQVRPGDVAILCRTNDHALAVAKALSEQGISAAVRRRGILETAEAQLALAALQLWVSPAAPLPMAQIAQAVTYAGREEEWLDSVLDSPGARAFAASEPIRSLSEARERMPGAGALAAFDSALEAVGLAEVCLRWGNSRVRLGNLDALRARAVAFERDCEIQGRVASPVGLIAALRALPETKEDTQASPPSDDAVVVETWHRSKGLEWPVTILHDLDHVPPSSPFGVRVESDRALALEDPLAGRWVRYLPSPLSKSQTRTSIHERIAAHPSSHAAAMQEERQELRLTYVGWTRAKDRVVLACRGRTGKDPSDSIRSMAMREGWALGAPRQFSALPPVRLEPEADEGWVAEGTREHPPAWRSPSGIDARGSACGEAVSIGDRKSIAGAPDMESLGNAIHAFLAADRSELGADERCALAGSVLEQWGVDGALQPNELEAIGDDLRRWVASRWPAARWRREYPMLHRLADGSTMRGTIDLLLEVEGGFVILDHKSFPGNRVQAVERAQAHVGQLGAYADAVRAATGKAVLGAFLHLATTGLILPIETT